MHRGLDAELEAGFLGLVVVEIDQPLLVAAGRRIDHFRERPQRDRHLGFLDVKYRAFGDQRIAGRAGG